MERRCNMAVQITTIICFTIIALAIIETFRKDKDEEQ